MVNISNGSKLRCVVGGDSWYNGDTGFDSSGPEYDDIVNVVGVGIEYYDGVPHPVIWIEGYGEVGDFGKAFFADCFVPEED